MKRHILSGWMMVGIVGVLACNAPVAATVTPTPTVTATSLPASTATPSDTEPTAASTTVTPTPAQSTNNPSTDAAPTSAGIDRVKIYLVALEDNGVSGDAIGCQDSIIAVERQLAPTQAPLRAALEELLSLRDQYVGQSGLYNALYQSRLTVKNVTIDANGKAVIYLEGSLLSGGTCDDPRIIAQLTSTARQFSTVKEAAIYVNGTLIEELLSGQ
jgi:hypothetical protein